MLRYRLTIFLGAFLLFSVQLLLGKYFLPWFGGTPAMWTTCILFFQALLLAGYTYAHALTSRSSPRAQSAWHVTLLLMCLLLLVVLGWVWRSPITPDASWKPQGSDHPIWRLLSLLTVSVGLPFFVLSTTGPLVQAWFARIHPDKSPYRLYALSNLGSFLGLLSYPFLVEPWLTLTTQARLWSWAFLAYAIGCGYCALEVGSSKDSRAFRGNGRSDTGGGDGDEAARPDWGSCVLWVSLAACASLMFLATTNQLCQDFAVVPLLWVLPLSLYLLSLVICFDRTKWYSRGVFHPALGLALLLACYELRGGVQGRILVHLVVYSFVLFICCMVCHGELARSKPPSRYLTWYYLMVAAGGVAGGIFVALIAPWLFKAFWEYQFGLWGSASLIFLILLRDRRSWPYSSWLGLPLVAVGAALLLPLVRERGGARLIAWATSGARGVFFLLLIVAFLLLIRRSQASSTKIYPRAAPWVCGSALLILGVVLFVSAKAEIEGSIWASRNFYGLLSISERDAGNPSLRAYLLWHGGVIHGLQYQAENRRNMPTTYFGRRSGVGMALLGLQQRAQAEKGSLRIGVVGLGIGTLAVYARAGDYIRFYEINPEVIRIARDDRYFTYLKDCPARLDVIQGDARLSMENELRRHEAQGFDLLAIDAFTGNAVPLHLLTEEAFQIYLNEIKKPEGVIAVDVSNRYIDLKPVLYQFAKHFGLKYLWILGRGPALGFFANQWVLLSQDEKTLDSISLQKPRDSHQTEIPAVRLWTDDYSDLFGVLKR